MTRPVGEERVGEQQGPVQQRTALRDALLRDLDLGGQPVVTRGELRLHLWLHRRHLLVLLLPWWLVRLAWWFFFSSERRAAITSKNRAIDLYRQATGMDRKAAWDQVWRLEGQLAPLVDRPEFAGLEPADESPGANRTELEAAADALLDHALAGRRSDDELLAAVLALWAESEDSMAHGYDRLVEQGITGRRAQTDAILAEARAWRVRYRLAWRRWFDRQAEQGSGANPGRR
jgi:hypothetical protein